MDSTNPSVVLATTTFLSMVTIGILCVLLAQRLQQVRSWRGLTITHWLVLIIYTDSTLFILISAVLSHGFGLNSSQVICNAAIYVCLIFYLTTKLIYYFLIEKAYIVSGVETPRLKSKLYCANTFGMLGLYVILAIFNFIFRISRFNQDGICIIGMERNVLIPVIVFDVLVNVYLTALFVVPLRKLHAFKNNPNSPLRVMTFRTFIGSCCTLISSVANLTIVVILNGEHAWICLLCCNVDILFSAVVVHWVTNRDSANRESQNRTSDTMMSDFHRNVAMKGTKVDSIVVTTGLTNSWECIEDSMVETVVDMGNHDGNSIHLEERDENMYRGKSGTEGEAGPAGS